MKTSRFILLGLAALALLPLTNAQVATVSNITEVYVYSGSARVTREALVELSEGENTLLFSGLPTSLDVNQIQVGLKEGVPIRLDNLKFQQVKDREDTDEEETLKSALEELRDRIQVLNSQKQTQSSRVAFARSLGTSFTTGFGESELETDVIKRAEEVLTFQQTTVTEAEEEIRELDKEITELDKDLKELLKELAEVTNKANRLQGQATVKLFSAESGSVNLVFNYLVPNASWFPSYAIRVGSQDKSMDLVYQANLWQNSGESWENVAVTVSTSQPTRSGNVPELQGVFLQPNQYSKRKQSFGNVVSADSEMSVRMAVPASAEYAAEPTVQAGMSSFSATLPSRVTLESETEPSRFTMMTKGFDADFWSEVVPLIQEKGFLKSKTTNAFDLPLIAGQAQVFIDGTLTSRVSVPYALPGDELELSLGVDDFIIVNRKETLRETEYAGLIDKTTVLKRAYTIEVTNFHPVSHKVKVFERFPISRNEKITVKRRTPPDSAVEIEDDTGVFYWEESLSAKELKEYKVAFEVVHPREWNLEHQI